MMDSSERSELIEAYGQAYDNVTAALKVAPAEMWAFKPASDSWSIHEIVIHLADSEACSYIRLRYGAAEPGSTIVGYDEALWAVRMDYAHQSCDDAMELFKWLRRMSYQLIKTLPEATWAHTVEHTRAGTWTLDDWLRIYVYHARAHVEQIQACHRAWLQGQPAR